MNKCVRHGSYKKINVYYLLFCLEISVKIVRRPEQGALMPCEIAEPNRKKDFLFFPGKSSANEKPLYLEVSIPPVDSFL